ncbi:MAG: hypothetical protein PHQ27_02325 [Victivallales bacterium]|nr:hypothetical protein [Victivallales bacterium]
MKSAWELALERTGGALRELTPDQKNRIAEIESIYKAKIAGAEIAAQQRVQAAAGDPEAVRQIMDDLAVERASHTSKMESEKKKIRG